MIDLSVQLAIIIGGFAGGLLFSWLHDAIRNVRQERRRRREFERVKAEYRQSWLDAGKQPPF